MIGVFGVFAQVDLNPVYLTREFVAQRAIILRYGRTGLTANIARLVGGKDKGFGLIDAALA